MTQAFVQTIDDMANEIKQAIEQAEKGLDALEVGNTISCARRVQAAVMILRQSVRMDAPE